MTKRRLGLHGQYADVDGHTLLVELSVLTNIRKHGFSSLVDMLPKPHDRHGACGSARRCVRICVGCDRFKSACVMIW